MMIGIELQNQNEQKQEIEKRLSALESGRRAVAVVLADRCAGCGLCADVCPNGAIRVDKQSKVDPWLCSACCACVQECPNEAIIIAQQRIAR
jgi:ferredoxin